MLGSDFKPSTQVVVINLFWFLGLILALITASLGMLVKQWLREYLSNDSTSPQARARIRYTRHDSLERWYVFAIAGALPSLLQGSLAFSLVALCLFIRQFHQALFYFLMSVSLLWFLFYGFVLVAPIFSSHCPYKSPSLRSTTRSLRHSVHHLLRTFFHLPQPQLSFLDPGPLVEEADIRISSEHDEYIWTQADALFFDDRLVKETVHMCLADVDGPAVVRCVQSIASRREPKVEPSNLIEHGQDSVSLTLLNALVREVRTQIHGKETFEWKSWMREAYSLLLENWEYCSDDVGKHHLADFLLAVIKQDWAISEHILRWRPDLSLPVLYFALKEGKVVHRAIYFFFWASSKLLTNLLLATENDSDSRKLFIIHQTVRSVRALLTLGPLSLQLPAGIASSAPHSGVINVITVCKVLLQSISSAPLLDMNIGAGLRRALELTAEISVLIDKVIHDVRRDLEQGDCPAWASMDQNETWESVRQMLKTIATTMDHNSIKGHTKKEWLTEFRDLHEITEQKR